MKNKKMLSVLLVVTILIGVMIPTIVLADDFTGYVNISSNTTPTIDVFTVDGIAPMTPTGTCNVSITVTDGDGFDNIDSIMLLFWHSTTAGDPTDLPSFNQSDNDSSLYNWIEVWDSTQFTADTTNTTWSSTTPTSPSGGNSHTFSFVVTVGKEAQEVSTASDTDKWLVAVKVTDANSNTAFMLPNGASNMQIPTSWYGEMIADAGAGPQWTSASAGMAYADLPAQVFDNSATLSIISNGDYSLQTYSDTTWNNGTSDILYDTAIDAAEEFSIAVDTVTTYNVGTAQELTNDGDADGHTEPITVNTPIDASWGSGTAYDGIGITNIYMFLQTNASMTTSVDDYSGTVTFTVVNN